MKLNKQWSRKFEKCLNCQSVRFNHRSRGYCKRCYPLIIKYEKVKLWDLKRPKSLVGYPNDGIFYTEDLFSKIQKGFIKQIKERLDDLKISEYILNGKVSGMNIVPKFQKIAKLAGSRNKDFLWHAENLFDHNFTPKQKKILYKILNDITEAIPWRGINWNEIFDE